MMVKVSGDVCERYCQKDHPWLDSESERGGICIGQVHRGCFKAKDPGITGAEFSGHVNYDQALIKGRQIWTIIKMWKIA
jgi:hypothetical protein